VATAAAYRHLGLMPPGRAGELFGNDSDADNDPLTVISFTVDGDPTVYQPGDTAIIAGVETLTIDADGNYTFTPAPDYNGPVPDATYTVSDGQGGSNTYTVNLTVTAVNDTPVATGGSLSTTEDTQATGTLTATDVDNANLTYAVVTQPANGSVNLGANGAYTYTPAANFNGSDSFTFKANDGSADSNTATVTITVSAVNDAPVVATPLADRSVTLGSSLNFSFGASAFTDVETANLTYTATRADGTVLPAWLSFNAGTRTFSGTPASGDLGTISVKVTASDGSLSDSDTFDVVVSQRPNTAPVAANASGSTSEDTALTASLPAATDGELALAHAPSYIEAIKTGTLPAAAQREIGLSAGEPPTTKGYTPTVFSELPRLLERAGPGVPGQGSITGLFTVLVEGDDTNEPIADAVRGILDGHIVLDREIAQRGRYPAINILRSVSRMLPDCNNDKENALITMARRFLSTYENMAELIRLGAYRRGTDQEVDRAMQFYPLIEQFITQRERESSNIPESYTQLAKALGIDWSSTAGEPAKAADQ
jgi:VCBS repeat-containing protein